MAPQYLYSHGPACFENVLWESGQENSDQNHEAPGVLSHQTQTSTSADARAHPTAGKMQTGQPHSQLYTVFTSSIADQLVYIYNDWCFDL